MDNLFDLTGRVAVVTGASSGLGADAARAYAGQGADVALLARRVEKLKTVADEIAATGRKVLVVGCDVTDEEQVRKAIGQVVARFGKIDILLNNAGVAVPGTVEQLTTDEWDKEMNTNVRGAYLVCKYVVPHMRERRYGKIVNISSVNALIADKSPLLARHVYNASKAAVLGLTIGMAASYGVDGITVNAVCPGLFESEMTEDTLFKNEEFMRMYNFTDPMSRPGRRGELNGTILYFRPTLRVMSPVSTWSSMAVPASSDGRAADEGRSVLWRADFRHDHINGEACREGGGENAVFTGRCPASNEKHPADSGRVFLVWS